MLLLIQLSATGLVSPHNPLAESFLVSCSLQSYCQTKTLTTVRNGVGWQFTLKQGYLVVHHRFILSLPYCVPILARDNGIERWPPLSFGVTGGPPPETPTQIGASNPIAQRDCRLQTPKAEKIQAQSPPRRTLWTACNQSRVRSSELLAWLQPSPRPESIHFSLYNP